MLELAGWFSSQARTRCQVSGRAPAGMGGLKVGAARWWLGGCAGGTPQHPGLGAAPASEQSALGLVKVEHSSQRVAGFDKAMRTFCLISNEGGEGVQAMSGSALLPLWVGQQGCPCPTALGEAGEEGSSDKRKVRGRKMLGMCFLI